MFTFNAPDGKFSCTMHTLRCELKHVVSACYSVRSLCGMMDSGRTRSDGRNCLIYPCNVVNLMEMN
jgi:hypothetical protein